MDSKQLLDNLSSHLKNSIARGIALSASLNAEAVAPSHLLLAIAEESGSVGTEILKKMNLPPEVIRKYIISSPFVQKENPSATTTLPQLSAASKHALEKAMLIAYERSHSYVGTEHLLYGIFHSNDSAVKKIMEQAQMSIEEIEDRLDTIFLGTSKFPDAEDMEEMVDHMNHIMEDEVAPMPIKSKTSQTPTHTKKQLTAMDIFTINLTSAEAQKNIDPVIGRDKEIERVINILCRRHKNNPILVGEAGVGKTAIVEGLAKKIYNGDVPDILKRKKILSLDMALLISGTIYRGEFEARLRQIIEEVSRDTNCILFVDEMHNIIGAGSNNGAMDAANLMKPALARGQLRCIGATTIDEYAKHIKTDPALERRLQPVFVNEPSREDTVKILHGVAPFYETFHNVSIKPDAILAAVNLSSKYIHDNYLPDKAIDLLDEAAARARALAKFNGVEKNILELEKKISSLEAQKEEAIHSESFQNAIDLKKELAEVEKELSVLKNKKNKAKNVKRRALTKEDIGYILGTRLGIDPNILLQDELSSLADLEKRLISKIIGQDSAIARIIQKLRHAHMRQPEISRPLASFLFAGPSGVGKTALAKTLATELYHDAKALISFDMSEFAESHSISKILGAPAGYIGHNERNRFTDEIRKRPYSVILFDEFDKAHPDVRRLLLQILDEGELTDSRGKKISFAHAIIILTTNLGAELFASGGIGFGNTGASFSNTDRTKVIINKLKEEFGSALMSRLEDVCLFSPLSNEHLFSLTEKRISEISDHLAKTLKLNIITDKKAVERMVRENANADLGARHVEQSVERIVHDLVANIINNSKRKKTYTLTTTAESYKLV